MSNVDKMCLEICEEILISFSDKMILNRSLTWFKNKSAEVILTTKEDEYKFLLNVYDEVKSESEDHLNVSEKIYNLKSVAIKGYDAVECGKVEMNYLKKILEKLAENHIKCIEDKENNKTSVSSVLKGQQEPFLEVLHKILKDIKDNVDVESFLTGIQSIQKAYEKLLCCNENVYISSNLETILFVKTTNESFQEYKFLNLKTENDIPLVYNVLLTIFCFTDQTMRQNYFHELTDHYYKCLENNLHKVCVDITEYLPVTVFQTQIHEFTPLAKLEILKRFCKTFIKAKTNLKYVRELIMELHECILYPKILREDCYAILKNTIGSTDYKFLNYELRAVEEREGFLGDYFKLKIEIEQSEGTKAFNFFVKCLPTYNELARDLAAGSFKKEEFYYLKFIPEIKRLGWEDITDFLPKCYFTRTLDVLVLEDLSASNYKCFPVRYGYTYEMLEITIKQLAKIHACSLLYEEILSEKTEEVVRLDMKFPEYVKEAIILDTEKIYHCAIKTFLKVLEVFPDVLKDLSLEDFKNRAKLVLASCFEKVKKSDKYRNVLCQGDCWSSNILFKTNNDLPVDCRLVDYQLTRYCPAGHDLYFLLYMATTRETRKQFEGKLFQLYYSELKTILQKYNVDIQKIYTYQEFLDSCEYMRSQGLSHAIMVLQFVLFPEEKMRNILKDKEQIMQLLHVNRDVFVKELHNEGYYKQRMKELVQEMYEMCDNKNFECH